MNDPRRVEQLFNDALQRANHIERHVYLTAACGNDVSLWNEVWDRLRNRPATSGKRTRGLRVAKVPPQSAWSERSGDLIGPYRLIQILESSACGVTWAAERVGQAADLVTIKVVPMPAESFLARMREQKHTLALLDHPGIIKPLASGVTEAGHAYLVADLVRGTPITQFCDDQKLCLLKRILLFRQACEIVQNAHQKGVVHGQISPACLLALWENGEPVLKITDFGLARAMDHLLAMPDGRVRTPTAYLSPEHVTGGTIDVSSDVHSLGAVLYELLVGRQPFATTKENEENLDEVRRLLCETVPARPSVFLSGMHAAQLAGLALSRRLEPDGVITLMEEQFDEIVMRALEKRPSERFVSVAAMAAALLPYIEKAKAEAEKLKSEASTVGSFISEHRATFTLGAMILMAGVVVMLILGGAVLLEDERGKRAAVQRKEESHSMTARFLQEMFTSLTPEKVKDHDATLLRNMLDEAVEDIEALNGNPEAAAQTQETIGLTYLAMSQPADAQKQLQGALDKRKLALGPEHHDTVRSMRNLALALKDQGRHADAEVMLRQTLNLQQRRLGPDDPDTYLTITVIAAVCDAQEKHIEAEKLYLNLWQLQKRVLGPDHLDTLATIGHLAESYSAQGRAADALKLREQQLASTQRTCGMRSPQTLVSMNITAQACEAGGMPSQAEKLYFGVLDIMTEALGAENPETLAQADRAAMLLGRCGRHNDALRLLRQTLEAKQRVLGKEAPETLLSMKCVANELEALGKYTEAEATQQNVLEVLRGAFPPEHPEILGQMDQLAQTFESHGRHAVAVDLRQQSLKVRQRNLGASHPDTLRSMRRLAEALDASGRQVEAEKMQSQTLAMMKAAYGPGDPDVLVQMRAVALMHDRHGGHAAAKEILREELVVQQRALGPEHADTLATMSMLADVCQHAGRLDEAETLHQQVLEIRRRSSSNDPSGIVEAGAHLGAFWLQTGRFAEAESLLRECLDLAVKDRPDHWMRFSLESGLGGALLGQKKYVEAGKLLRSGYEGLLARSAMLPPEEVHQLRDALERLASFTEATGSVAESALWKQKLTELVPPHQAAAP